MLVGDHKIIDAKCFHRLHILFFTQGQHSGAGLAINATPAGQHKDENQVTQATAKDHAQHHNEDQLRERHEHLGQTKHDLIKDAALIAAVAAQQHADDCRD